MKTKLLFLVSISLFFLSIATAQTPQEETAFELKDTPFEAGLFHNIPLSEKWTLQGGLSIRKNIDYDTFEIPIVLKYQHTNKWSSFLRFQSRTMMYSNYPDYFSGTRKPSNSYFSYGMEYKFNETTTGNFAIGFPLNFNLGLSF